MRKDQNNHLVPLGPPFSWLAKENLKFIHNLYLCSPMLLISLTFPPHPLYIMITFTNPADMSERFTT